MNFKEKTDLEVITFKSPKEFEQWLSDQYQNANGLWVRFFKKESAEKSITYDEALDEALCYGWIDGLIHKYDDQSYIRKFTPRRPKSIWSKRNIEHIDRLTKAARMKPSGLAEVEKAKADGRWTQAYDSPEKMTLPDDFMNELLKDKKAKAFFDILNKANQYAIAWRLQTAKKPETREKRMKAILEMLSRGEKFH